MTRIADSGFLIEYPNAKFESVDRSMGRLKAATAAAAGHKRQYPWFVVGCRTTTWESESELTELTLQLEQSMTPQKTTEPSYQPA